MRTLTVGNVAQIDDVPILYVISMTCRRSERDSNPRYGFGSATVQTDALLAKSYPLLD